jgi:hypothetical protein
MDNAERRGQIIIRAVNRFATQERVQHIVQDLILAFEVAAPIQGSSSVTTLR